MISLYSDEDSERVADITKTAAPEPYRSPWRRDIGRLLHCPSFRRLQSKTQVFPGTDSDFFRSRLTHSLEVAQIGKSIAIKLNDTDTFFKPKIRNIIPEIVEFGALAHDLGHPPFGHNGEEALHNRMKNVGGFEGNAQTLHLLTRVEKKQVREEDGEPLNPIDAAYNDNRLGLNLTYRSLASILKYDRCIPNKTTSVKKGYYGYNQKIVDQIKAKVLRGKKPKKEFKTIECSIMDISDDIAYSTYDLEDCFKAGLLTPLQLFTLSPDIIERVLNTITKRLREYLKKPKATFSEHELLATLVEIFSDMFQISEEERKFIADPKATREMKKLHEALQVEKLSTRIAKNGYERVKRTSDLVQTFMDGVEVEYDEVTPALSKAKLNLATFKKVEVLKNITYEAVIMSPRMRVVEYRGHDVIYSIFDALDSKNGFMLLPEDYRELYRAANKPQQKRLICDFIAGMTDRYAWQFYNRICGSDSMTIYLPV
jgi:dGTPase